MIHKGYIPTYEEAYLYGKLVFDYLKNFHIFLRENQLDDFNVTRLYYLSQKIHNVDNLPITNLGIVSILVMSNNISFNFEDTLKKFYEYHDYIKDLPKLQFTNTSLK